MPNQRLAVGVIMLVDNAYQFFADGKLLGGVGTFTNPRKPPRIFQTQSKLFPLPQVDADNNHPEFTVHTLAFRVWMGTVGLLHQGSEGGLRGGPVCGPVDAVAAQVKLDRYSLLHWSLYFPFEMLLLLLFAVLAAGQTLFDPADRAYLAVAAVLVIAGLYDVTFLLSLWRVIDAGTYFLIDDVLLDPLLLSGWTFVWWIWFRLRRPVWIPWAIGALTLLHAAAAALDDSYIIYTGPELLPYAQLFHRVSIAVGLLCVALLFFIVALGIRKHAREGWMVLPAALLLALQQFTRVLFQMGLVPFWRPFGVMIFIGQVANLFLVGAIALLMLRRLLLSVRRQRQMAIDVKQAHEVQQVLIPEAIPEVPGFNIKSVYLPAGEVGGDFFQIIKTAQGGVLLCIGDVSGKGLPAAMTVSLLVGTFRTLARFTQSPSAILDAMNTRMLGRSRGGFTTCLVMRLDPDGALTMANAGHLAPFVGGHEVALESGLPLGLSADSTYAETQVRLGDAETLTALTDGVVEARNTGGELFGFERTAAIASEPAERIVQAAQAFGQEDDITVLTVAFAGARVAHT
jgi:hypothetical protein